MGQYEDRGGVIGDSKGWIYKGQENGEKTNEVKGGGDGVCLGYGGE